MSLKSSFILHFFASIFLANKIESQSVSCDFHNRWQWIKTLDPRLTENNDFYYSCSLSTGDTDYTARPTKIVGEHMTDMSNEDVKYLGPSPNQYLRTYSAIYCNEFSNLEVVIMYNLLLESIDLNSLVNCKNLQYLNFAANMIRSFPENLLIHNKKIFYIKIHNNQLKTLPEKFFIKQTELEGIDMNNNQINFLPSKIFASQKKLQKLYIPNNKLTTIDPEWFRNTESLRILSFVGNKISEIPAGAFTNLQNLQELYMSKNMLTTIHSQSFGTHIDLTTLYFDNNQITTFDEKLVDNTAVSIMNMTNNVCSSFYTDDFDAIKPELEKCFEGYQPGVNVAVTMASMPALSLDVKNDMNHCGLRKIGRGTVFGGARIKRGAYPWTAAIVKRSGGFLCGGTLITDRKIVTAAHCFQDKESKVQFTRQDVAVLLGVHDLNNPYETERSHPTILSLHIHPDWNTETEAYDADIAVLMLENSVIFTRYIQPACLIDPNSPPASVEIGVVAGFGKSEDTSKVHENIPKELEMPIYENSDCFLKNYIFARLSSHRTFCGGTGNGTGACQGDSGSGIVVYHEGAYYLRGIVSASLYNSTYGCDVDSYSIFTNMMNYNDWINDIKPNPNLLFGK